MKKHAIFALSLFVAGVLYAETYTKDQNGNIVKSETLAIADVNAQIVGLKIEIDQYNQEIANLDKRKSENLAQIQKRLDLIAVLEGVKK